MNLDEDPVAYLREDRVLFVLDFVFECESDQLLRRWAYMSKVLTKGDHGKAVRILVFR